MRAGLREESYVPPREAAEAADSCLSTTITGFAAHFLLHPSSSLRDTMEFSATWSLVQAFGLLQLYNTCSLGVARLRD